MSVREVRPSATDMNHLNLTSHMRQQRRPPFINLGLTLHHFVGSKNIQELNAIHKDAKPTAVYYVSTIFMLYLFGLLVVLIHYMNSAYGSWSWTLTDLWEELYRPSPKPNSSPSGGPSSKSRTNNEAHTHFHLDGEDRGIEATQKHEILSNAPSGSGITRSRLRESLTRLRQFGRRSSTSIGDRSSPAHPSQTHCHESDKHMSLDETLKTNYSNSVSGVSEVGSMTMASSIVEESTRRRMSSHENILISIDKSILEPAHHSIHSCVHLGGHCQARGTDSLEALERHRSHIVVMEHGHTGHLFHHHCRVHGHHRRMSGTSPICEVAEEEEEAKASVDVPEEPLETTL